MLQAVLDKQHANLTLARLQIQRLDELARWLLGEPHRFLEGAQSLRRVEA